MQIEYELRILNIDKQVIVAKLEAMGAEKIHEEILQRRYIMDFPDNRLYARNAWLRLRAVGSLKVECTLKQRLDNTSIRNAQEIDLEVNSLEKAKELFEFLGLEVKKYQENKRLSYAWDNIRFDIDTYLATNPYLEIESSTEEAVWRAVAQLGFTRQECTFTAGQALLESLGFDKRDQKYITFDENNS